MRRPSLRPRHRPSTVADRVHSAAIHLLRGLRKQDEAIGLTAARLSALSVVVFGGPVSIGQLANAEQVSVPTVTRLLVGMEREKLLRRKRDTRDRRIIWIRATSKGAKLLKKGRRRRVAVLAKNLASLEEAQLACLAEAAEIIERIAALGREPPR